ncbi:MFS transporter [Duganella sp. CY15W]|uniref:MFS transporter n=1 Tax=Duganella sp. CY15W TaxID=2692172 RepID=UPI00136DCDB8|nr:MFS transporter [Duganella sp. CY15W]MYM29946.1 MFS transporter [Duganella sp. CY15W]
MPSSFHRLTISNLSAHAAQQVGMAAAPLIAVTALHADVGQTAWIQLAQMLPFLLLSIPAGVLADRVSRKWLMRSGETLRALSLLCVPFIVMMGAMNIPFLALLGFVGSMGALAYSVSVSALIQGLVSRDVLPIANGRLELTRSIAFIGGPALAGALVAWTGVNQAFMLAATLSVVAIVLLSGIPEAPRGDAPRRHFIAELVEGGRFALQHPLLRPAFGLSVVFNTAFFILQTVFMPYAVTRLNMNAAQIGVTLSMYGIGMVTAGFCVPWMVRRMSMGQMLAGGSMAGLVAVLALMVTLWHPAHWLAGLCFFVLGGGPVLWTVSFTTLRQLITPDELMGRVTSINSLATYGSRPLGAALAGVIGTAFGMEACLYVVTGIFTLEVVLLWMSPLPWLDAQKLKNPQGR